MKVTTISNSQPENFVSCRVGIEVCNYQEDIKKLLEYYDINGSRNETPEQLKARKGKGNFILIPLTPPRYEYYDFNGNSSSYQGDTSIYDYLLPDLALDKRRWLTEVAVSIGRLPFYSSNPKKVYERFDTLLRHALYLSALVIVIDIPETESTHPKIAVIINQRLKENRSQRLVLIRVSLTARHDERSPVRLPGWLSGSSSNAADTKMDATDESTGESGFVDQPNSSPRAKKNPESTKDEVLRGWAVWNSIRGLLVPDHRIGVCLSIDDDLEHDLEEAARWNGEPVRMIILGLNRFCSPRNFKAMRPAGAIKEFIKMVAISNSLTTSFVLQTRSDCDIQDHLDCLSHLCDALSLEYPDATRCWDDTPLDPLQPLANNLDSHTYSIFEDDRMKYSMYHDAIFAALDSLLARAKSLGRDKFVIMVLGAGRGPLVDATISAVHKLKLGKFVAFKIYALDKNRSSIVSLKYKQAHMWNQFQPHIQTRVVEADMRYWTPSEKADIIVTELLGSFSDNELSPECIDGTWRFTTPETICIPQTYTSYLAPVTSYRMRQELHKAELLSSGTNHFDSIQVVKMKNHHIICDPQPLFSFDHSCLGYPPVEGANQREETLSFTTGVDAVCDGFAGYFAARLFGKVIISTVPEAKTLGMESWFPTFVPIDKPIFLPANSNIVVNFSRKESAEKVWYEWKVIEPVESRIYCQNGSGVTMSKVI